MEGSREIQLVLFYAHGAGIGFDGAQVQSLGNPGDDADGCVGLHECFGKGDYTAGYEKPRRIVFKHNPGRRFLCEEPIDIISVEKSRIKRIPALIRSLTAGMGLWGVYHANGVNYFLYDAEFFIRGCNE